MPEEPENLTLRYLRRIDERTARIEETQTEHGERLTTIERSCDLAPRTGLGRRGPCLPGGSDTLARRNSTASSGAST